MEAYEIHVIHIFKSTLAAFAENSYEMSRHKLLFRTVQYRFVKT